MIFNVSGGGGAALNFRVVGGTTAPTNPAENCIWVNTNTAITSWIFSATEPSPAEAGMVWISIGVSSVVEFNALKKNGIQVYPISAKQYISGAWVDKTATSYQGGVWCEWIPAGALYWQGDQRPDITGGWETSVFDAENPYVGGTRSEKDGVVTLDAAGGERKNIKYLTQNMVNLANAKTLNINILQREGVSNDGFLGVNFWVSTATTITEAATSSTVAAIVGIPSTGLFSIDVSNLSGSYYVKIECYNSICAFDKIWWE